MGSWVERKAMKRFNMLMNGQWQEWFIAMWCLHVVIQLVIKDVTNSNDVFIFLYGNISFDISVGF